MRNIEHAATSDCSLWRNSRFSISLENKELTLQLWLFCRTEVIRKHPYHKEMWGLLVKSTQWFWMFYSCQRDVVVGNPQKTFCSHEPSQVRIHMGFHLIDTEIKILPILRVWIGFLWFSALRPQSQLFHNESWNKMCLTIVLLNKSNCIYLSAVWTLLCYYCFAQLLFFLFLSACAYILFFRKALDSGVSLTLSAFVGILNANEFDLCAFSWLMSPISN